MDGTVAIVTGGGGRIGRGVCRALSEAGATVVAVDLDPSAAQGTDHKVVCDLTDADACAALVDDVVAEHGGIDTLVNVAQWIRPPGPFVEQSDDDLRRGYETGPIATFRMMKLCHPHLQARGGGAIVNFGSSAGTEGGAGWATYSSAKDAIRALAKVASLEWGGDNIRVNTICPIAGVPDDTFVHDALVERIPLHRIGDPAADIGAAVVFLATAGSYITGHTLMVDGGLGRFR